MTDVVGGSVAVTDVVVVAVVVTNVDVTVGGLMWLMLLLV